MDKKANCKVVRMDGGALKIVDHMGDPIGVELRKSGFTGGEEVFIIPIDELEYLEELLEYYRAGCVEYGYFTTAGV